MRIRIRQGIEENRTCAIHTTDSRALSITSLEYYNLDALGRKGTT
jgi:hypothetical protein